MKVDSNVSNSINIQNTNNQSERSVRPRIAAEADSIIKKVSGEADKKVEQEDIINDDMLNNSVEQANKALRVHNKYIERSVHEKTHTIMYILRDTDTKEIIREFPPRKIQDMIAKMWELAGLLVDERR